MKCLLIGGGGFLGSNLCDSLLDKGFSVKIFERPNLLQYRCFLSDEKIEWIEGDFLNPKDISKAISDCDIIYHFASTTIPESSNANPVYDIETNLIATLKLVDLSCKNGIKKIIFPSSGGTVYGIPEIIPIKESHPCNPLCSYGITKLAIEKYHPGSHWRDGRWALWTSYLWRWRRLPVLPALRSWASAAAGGAAPAS